jgi:uncharacterized membrane protein YtjA (UPF0391 family)
VEFSSNRILGARHAKQSSVGFGHLPMPDRPNLNQERTKIMLSWALTFLILALIAGVLGFGGIAGAASGIAQILFFVFLVLLIISAIARALRGRTP